MRKNIIVSIMIIASLIVIICVVSIIVSSKKNTYQQIIMQPNQQIESSFKVNKESKKVLFWEFKDVDPEELEIQVYENDSCIYEGTNSLIGSIENLDNETQIKILVRYVGLEEKKIQYKFKYAYIGGIGNVMVNKDIKLS